MKWFGKHINPSSDPAWLRSYNATRAKNRRHRICHAPFKSLTFFLGGKVMSCWHNKQYLLGSIPENSIREIWGGSTLQHLRNAIEEKNLDKGCYDCKKNLQSKNFSAAGAPRYDYLPETGSGFPVSMDFQIDDTCNNECVMCNGEYSSTVRTCREKKERYVNPYDNGFIVQLDEFIPYLKEASFSGGEVFLSGMYFRIWDRFLELNPGIKVSVTTNGTVLNDKVRDYLSKMHFNINLSLDTLDPDLFAGIRRNSSVEVVLKNLDYFLNYSREKGSDLTVRVCIMQQNWQRVPELIRFLNDKGVRIHINQVIFPAYSSLLACSPVKIHEIIQYLSSAFSEDIKMTNKNRSVWDDFLATLSGWQKLSEQFNGAELKGMTAEQLKEEVLKKINRHIHDRTFGTDTEKQELMDETSGMMALCVRELPSDVVQNAFRYYLLFPVNRLVDEIQIRTAEKMLEFTRQAGTMQMES